MEIKTTKIEKKIKASKLNQIQKFKYSAQKILTGSDLSSRHLPLMEVKSINPGPVIWLTGCLHGDEVGGIAIIQEIFKLFKKHPLKKGSVYAFPLLNSIGFESRSRDITFSKEDLNRSFPGKPDGSLAERIAHKIFTTIKNTNPNLVLDLHNDWIMSVPYSLIDPLPSKKNKSAYKKVKTFAKKTGLLIVGEGKEDITPQEEKTLSFSLIKENIPALTLELGEAYVVNEEFVRVGISTVWKILSYLKMVDPLPEEIKPFFPKRIRKKTLRYSDKPISSTSGIIRFLVNPGEIVVKGQPVAKIYNAFGRLEETLTAQNDSVVLGYSDYSVALPGIPIMAFGIISSSKKEPKIPITTFKN